MSEYEIELYKIMGQMIRNERERRSITLEQLASSLGVTPKTIQRYEKGERKIKLGMLMELCDVLQVNYDEFMSRAKKSLVSSGPLMLHDNSLEYNAPSIDNVYLSFAKEAQDEGIEPEDIRDALDLIKKLRGEK